MGDRVLGLAALALGIATVAALAAGLALWLGVADHSDETGGAALLSVAATLALAAFAALTIRQNRDLVEAATNEAEASAKAASAAAQTVAEMQAQREMAYRPHLVITLGTTSSGLPPHDLFDGAPAFVIANIGNGPALNVAFSARQVLPNYTSWISEVRPGIAPHDEWRVPMLFPGPEHLTARHQRYRCLTDDLLTSDQNPRTAAVRYDDWQGNTWRAPGSARDIQPARYQGPQGMADQPDWMRCQ